MCYAINPIETSDDPIVCDIIKQVGAEYGAIGEGFGPSDNEVSAMSIHYTEANCSCYLVAKVKGEIVGGCGIAPFNQSREYCELKKLFLLPDSRGLGIGRQLVEACLTFAQSQGFTYCYLDTLSNMTQAISLYERFDFVHLKTPLLGTEHNGCDVWMLKSL